jgi:hypothetical protein
VRRHDNPELEFADSISITFEIQKKDERDDMVTQYASGHQIRCPVRAWAAVVKRIRSYPGAANDKAVSALWQNNCIEHVKSQDIIDAIHRASEAIDWDGLGVKKGDFGTHIPFAQELQWRYILTRSQSTPS